MSKLILLIAASAVSVTAGLAQQPPVTRISREQLVSAPTSPMAPEMLVIYNGQEKEQLDIVDLAVDASGNIFLLDALREGVLRFGHGQGLVPLNNKIPNGLHNPLRLAVARDTILILDASTQDGRPALVLHLLSTEGAYLGSVSTPSLRGTIFSLRNVPSGWLFGYATLSSQMPAPKEPYADSSMLMTLDPATFTTKLVHASRVGTRYPAADDWSLLREMAFTPAMDAASDGFVYIAETARYEVDVRSSDGDLLKVIRADASPVPFTRTDFMKALDLRIEDALKRGTPESTERASILQRFGPAIGHADHVPIIAAIRAGPQGRIMVRRGDLEYVAASGVQIWDLLHVDQGIIGRLTLPADVLVTDLEWPFLFVKLGGHHGGTRVRYRIQEASPQSS